MESANPLEKTKMVKTYPLEDRPTYKECKALGIETSTVAPNLWAVATPHDGRYIQAVKTGEKRPPHAGEWYLSGAIPAAYRAPSNLSQTFQLLRLVVVERIIQVVEKSR